MSMVIIFWSRLFLLGGLPLATTFLILLNLIWGQLKTESEMHSFQELIEMNTISVDLVHELQLGRGISTIFTSAEGQHTVAELTS